MNGIFPTAVNLIDNALVEIEQNLTTTQELNVNLQVLLENAAETQREADAFASQSIKSAQLDLARASGSFI
jgi:hypothetical protein